MTRQENVSHQPVRSGLSRGWLGASHWRIDGRMLALLPFLVLVAWHWSYQPLVSTTDYAQYLLHADALLHGKAYADIGYIFTSYNPFIGPRAEPPGLPLTLYPLLLLFGRSFVAAKMLMVVSGVVFLSLAGAYFAVREGEMMGMGVVLVTGAALEMAYATNAPMSDLGFCALVWAIILLADREGVWTAGRAAAIVALGVGAFLYRLAAVPLIPAVMLYGVLHFRRTRFHPALAVLLWSAVLLALLGAGGASSSEAAAGNATPGAAEGAGFGAMHHLRSAMGHVVAYRLGVFQAHLYPFPWKGADAAYHIASVAVMLVGLTEWLRRSATRFVAIFCGVYLAMLLSIVQLDMRYAWPLFPLFAFGLLNGLRLLFGWAVARTRPASDGRGAARWTLGTACAIVVLSMGSHAVSPRPASYVDLGDVRALFGRLRQTGSAGSLRVVFSNPRVLTWETGIPSMGLFEAAPDAAIAELRRKGITHVILGDLGESPSTERAMTAVVAAHPELFVPAYTNASFRMYRFAGGSPPVDRPATAEPRS